MSLTKVWLLGGRASKGPILWVLVGGRRGAEKSMPGQKGGRLDVGSGPFNKKRVVLCSGGGHKRGGKAGAGDPFLEQVALRFTLQRINGPGPGSSVASESLKVGGRREGGGATSACRSLTNQRGREATPCCLGVKRVGREGRMRGVGRLQACSGPLMPLGWQWLFGGGAAERDRTD